jgi:hypothetical protein
MDQPDFNVRRPALAPAAPPYCTPVSAFAAA